MVIQAIRKHIANINKYSVSAITNCENNPMRKHKYDFLLAESAKHLSLLSEEYSGRKDMFDIQIYRFSYMQFFSEIVHQVSQMNYLEMMMQEGRRDC